MGSVAPRGSEQASKPFSRFALAAPHDNGMNSMQNAEAMLNTIDTDMVKELTPHIPALSWFADAVSSAFFKSHILFTCPILTRS
jgi:hypothetical protein